MKLQLKKFDGKNIGDEYIIFKEQFMTLCGNRRVDSRQKLCFLLAYLEGQALSTARQAMGRGINDDSFRRVCTALDNRYGGEERMKRNYLNDLRNFQPLAKTTSDDLWKMHFLVSDIRDWMISENESQIFDKGSFVVQSIKEVLPVPELARYVDELEQHNGMDCMDTLHKFIQRRARSAQNMEESRRKSALQQRSFYTIKEEETDQQPSEDEDFETVLMTGEQKAEITLTSDQQGSGLIGPRHQTTRDSLNNKIPKSEPSLKLPGCPFCNEPHVLWKCESFKMQDLQKRYQTVKNKRLCYHCLAPGHGSKTCSYNKDKKCGIDGCTFYHNRLLHKPKNVALVSIEDYVRDEQDYGWENIHTDIVQHTVEDQVLVSDEGDYVSVRTTIGEIGTGKVPNKRIVIALDSCANNTNIDEDLAKELNLPILKSGIRREVKNMLGIGECKSCLVQFYLSPLGCPEKKFLLTGYTVKNLLSGTPIIDWEKESHKYPHLKKGNPAKSEPGDKIGVLLGTDYSKIQCSDAKLVAGLRDPCAERTELGWVFSGRVKNVQVPNRKQGVIGMSVINHVILSTLGDDPSAAKKSILGDEPKQSQEEQSKFCSNIFNDRGKGVQDCGKSSRCTQTDEDTSSNFDPGGQALESHNPSS